MIYGTKKVSHANGHTQHDDDVEMTSSPPEAVSTMEEAPLMTLSLVTEENLTGAHRCRYLFQRKECFG